MFRSRFLVNGATDFRTVNSFGKGGALIVSVVLLFCFVSHYTLLFIGPANWTQIDALGPCINGLFSYCRRVRVDLLWWFWARYKFLHYITLDTRDVRTCTNVTGTNCNSKYYRRQSLWDEKHRASHHPTNPIGVLSCSITILVTNCAEHCKPHFGVAVAERSSLFAHVHAWVRIFEPSHGAHLQATLVVDGGFGDGPQCLWRRLRKSDDWEEISATVAMPVQGKVAGVKIFHFLRHLEVMGLLFCLIKSSYLQINLPSNRTLSVDFDSLSEASDLSRSQFLKSLSTSSSEFWSPIARWMSIGR